MDEDSRSIDYSEEAPRRARVGPPPKSVPRTIAGLRLNILEAERGQVHRLLPYDYNQPEYAKTYPMPTGAELARLAAIKVGYSRTDPSTIYLRRCKARYLTSRGHSLPGMRSEREAASAARAAVKARAAGKEAAKQVDEIVEGVRVHALHATASLSDLFALMKKGLRQQMEAYTEGVALNGEPISPSEFQGACRLVKDAVLRMGLPSEDTTGTREDVFRELEAARDATREAIAMQGPVNGKEPS